MESEFCLCSMLYWVWGNTSDLIEVTIRAVKNASVTDLGLLLLFADVQRSKMATPNEVVVFVLRNA